MEKQDDVTLYGGSAVAAAECGNESLSPYAGGVTAAWLAWWIWGVLRLFPLAALYAALSAWDQSP